jgi:hypothetical protein
MSIDTINSNYQNNPDESTQQDKGDRGEDKEMEFISKVKLLEQKLFPEFENEISRPFDESGPFQFAPSVHFKNRLITGQDIDGFILDKEKKILSLGSGQAYLERLLVGLGVSKEAITVSDQNKDILPEEGFQQVVFNFNQQWPDFAGQQFDLIIAGDSIMLESNLESLGRKQEYLFNALRSAFSNLKPGGEIRFDDHFQEEEFFDDVNKKLESDGILFDFTFGKDLVTYQKKVLE